MSGLFRRLNKRDSGWFSFAVKKHSEYQRVKETQITRASLLGDNPTGKFKWVGEDGRIFKSKKAMLSA